MFAISDKVIIGLQASDQIDPAATSTPGSVELSMSYATRDDVDQLYRAWTALGFSIALEPTALEFGYTFVATDPDVHRLRVCATDTSKL